MKSFLNACKAAKRCWRKPLYGADWVHCRSGIIDFKSHPEAVLPPDWPLLGNSLSLMTISDLLTVLCLPGTPPPSLSGRTWSPSPTCYV